MFYSVLVELHHGYTYIGTVMVSFKFMSSVQVSGNHGGSASGDRASTLKSSTLTYTSGSSFDKSVTVSRSAMQCASAAADRYQGYKAGAASSSSDSSDSVSDSSESSSDSATVSSSTMQSTSAATGAAGAASVGDDSDSDMVMFMSHPAYRKHGALHVVAVIQVA